MRIQTDVCVQMRLQSINLIHLVTIKAILKQVKFLLRFWYKKPSPLVNGVIKQNQQSETDSYADEVSLEFDKESI